jgi:hypothetical protein
LGFCLVACTRHAKSHRVNIPERIEAFYTLLPDEMSEYTQVAIGRRVVFPFAKRRLDALLVRSRERVWLAAEGRDSVWTPGCVGNNRNGSLKGEQQDALDNLCNLSDPVAIRTGHIVYIRRACSHLACPCGRCTGYPTTSGTQDRLTRAGNWPRVVTAGSGNCRRCQSWWLWRPRAIPDEVIEVCQLCDLPKRHTISSRVLVADRRWRAVQIHRLHLEPSSDSPWSADDARVSSSAWYRCHPRIAVC